MKNKIQTAEEVYNSFYFKYKDFKYKGDENIILEAMREFARIHVKNALELASKKAKISSFKLSQYAKKPRWKKVEEDEEVDLFSYKMKWNVDKNSILKSYHIKNIK